MQDNNKQDDNINNLSFETAITELEAIVNNLEKGQITLEDSIKIYQRGQKLKEYCLHKLTDSRLVVEKISQNNGLLAAEKFDAE